MDHILVKGWVRTRRDSKGLSFLEINDGSCLKNLQIVVDNTIPDYANLTTVTTGAAV
jgi:asparaginyl-tRNA synthetase